MKHMNAIKKLGLSLVISASLFSVACTKKTESVKPLSEMAQKTEIKAKDNIAAASQPVAQVIKGNNPHATANAQPASANKHYAGKVLETKNAAGYTYLRLKDGKEGDLWFAIQESKIAVGQDVKIIESVVMEQFHSKTLNKTFEKIVFGALE